MIKDIIKKESVKNIILYSVITLVVIAVAVCIYNYIRSFKLADGVISYNIYYVDESGKKLDIEERIVNYVDDDKTMFNTVVDEFASGPSSTNQRLVLPAEFKIKSRVYSGKTAIIDLENTFNDMSTTDRILSIGALVYTLTDMSFIDNVAVTVDSEPIIKNNEGEPLQLDRQNVRNNPIIAPEKTEWQTVTLYFCDRSGNTLVSERRSIEVRQSLSIEYQIVEQLIAGPDKQMLKLTVPKNTEIRDIKTEDDICYVNLSKSFINDKVEGIDSKLVTIYSVVNSLTELDNVNKVQFIIEGEKIN